MWIRCHVSERRGRYPLNNAGLIHRVLRSMRLQSLKGLSVIAHRQGVYIVHRESNTGLRLLWLGIPQERSCLMTRVSDGLSVVANVDELLTDLPVQQVGPYLQTSRPACYDEAGEVGFIIPLSDGLAAVAVDPPSRVDTEALLHIRSRLEKSVPVPAGRYSLVDGFRVFDFTIGDIPAQMAFSQHAYRFGVLFKSAWETLRGTYELRMFGRNAPDVAELPIAEYDKLTDEHQLGDFIDPGTLNGEPSWKRAVKDSGVALCVSLSDYSHSIVEQLRARVHVECLYLALRGVFAYAYDECVASFAPLAATADVDGERKLLMLTNFEQPILDPVRFSVMGEVE